MKYKQLPKTHKADTIADAMYAREIEYFHYEFDAKNFEHLLDNAPQNADTTDLKKRLVDTRIQMEAVDNTYKALEAQITDHAQHEAAVIRTTKKREEDEIRSDK
jgi:predicted  nucleic acid-binding Zn-ribbon protein